MPQLNQHLSDNGLWIFLYIRTSTALPLLSPLPPTAPRGRSAHHGQQPGPGKGAEGRPSRLPADKAERLSRSNRASVLRAPATSHPRRGAADRGRPRSHLPRLTAAAAASGRGRRTQPRTASARREWREGVGWMNRMPSTGTSSAPATDTPGEGG